MIGKIPGIKRSPPLAGEGCFGRSRLYRQFSSHHAFMQSRTDKKLSPNSVRVYSTRGGASQKSWQGTRWALSLPCSKAFRRNAQPAPVRSCFGGLGAVHQQAILQSKIAECVPLCIACQFCLGAILTGSVYPKSAFLLSPP